MDRRMMSLAGLATLMLCGSVPVAHAQVGNYDFTGYSLLHGDNLSLYVNALGDVGAPRNGSSKPGGSYDPINKRPSVNANGSINTSVSETYGLLFSQAVSPGTLAQQISQRREYITVGTNVAVENYAVQVNGGAWVRSYDLGASNQFFSTGFNSGTGGLSALSSFDTNLGVSISQALTFNTPGFKNVAKFETTFTNNTSGRISLQYARALNPNQGSQFNGEATDTIETFHKFKTASDPTAFAIDTSPFPSGASPRLGIGVRPGDVSLGNGIDGTILLAATGATENDLLVDPDNLLTLENHVQLLDAASKDAQYIDIEGFGANNEFLTDYQTSDFANANLNPTGSVNPGILLLSGDILIEAGLSQTFTFYYFLDTLQDGGDPGAVPEPGTMALLFGSLLTGGLALKRRRK